MQGARYGGVRREEVEVEMAKRRKRGGRKKGREEEEEGKSWREEEELRRSLGRQVARGIGYPTKRLPF